jgi:hypothetical protein
MSLIFDHNMEFAAVLASGITISFFAIFIFGSGLTWYY